MKEKMETEIKVLSFGIPVIAQNEKDYEFSVEQLAWLEELAMEDHLAIPISERIKKIMSSQEEELWNRNVASEYVEQVQEELIAYKEVIEYFASWEEDEFWKENSDETMEEDAVSEKETESDENELILDDCG